MSTLHTAARPPRDKANARGDHLEIFREFLDHLDRAARRRDEASRRAAAPHGPAGQARG